MVFENLNYYTSSISINDIPIHSLSPDVVAEPGFPRVAATPGGCTKMLAETCMKMKDLD